MKILLRNGQLLKGQTLVKKDLLIENNIIKKIDDTIDVDDATLYDLNGKFISPGLIDMHVHLREPGFEHKETIQTGTMAGARGGYTLVCAMPNTKPVPDSVDKINHMLHLIEQNAVINVLPYAAISVGIKHGSELVDMKNLKDKVCGFTNDGYGIQTTKQMYETMQKAQLYETLIAAHCEDEDLLFGGVIHKGKKAKEKGLRGMTSLTESIHIARDVLIAEETKAAYHVCHISTKEGVRIIRDAKQRGVNVTAEVTPHHLLLTEIDVTDTNYKMNPPLRGLDDKYALISGLLDGTIDCISTDHAPHTEEEKAKGFEKAPFGIVGLETAFPLLYTHFVKTNMATLYDLITWMSYNPAKRLNLGYGKLVEGRVADITIIDLNHKKPIDKNTFYSKGKNTPFDGIDCYGWPVMTICNGKIVYKDGNVYE